MRARVIIFNEKINKIILIKRIKKNKEYWVIPGGGVLEYEETKSAAVREIKEELNILLEQEELIEFFEIENLEQKEIFYLAKIDFDENLKIYGEELERSNQNNQYLPMWINIFELPKINLFPQAALKKLIDFFF